jgi:putrescine aminotransferase
MPAAVYWHSQAHMPTVHGAEVVIDRGEGAYIWDADGRRLFDATASLWYCNVGHGRAEIANAVAEQIRRLETYHTFGPFLNAAARDLAIRLSDLSPMDEPRVFLTSGGSDSVDTAAKLARRYWSAIGSDGKDWLLTRDGSYHGLHGFGTSLTGIEMNREGLGPVVAQTARVSMQEPGALEDRILELGPDKVAAFFCEPVVGTGGVFPPADGYLEAVQEICRAHDVLFIVDEVITGFGRTGYPFACIRFDLDPDLMVLAKGLTSGYLPLGAVLVSQRVAAPFWEEGTAHSFRHGLTYSGHAAACAAAEVNLDILEAEHLIDAVANLEPLFRDELSALAGLPVVSEVRCIGLLAGVQVDRPELAQEIALRAPDYGFVTRALPGGTLQFSPPFVVTADEIRWLAEAVRDVISALS